MLKCDSKNKTQILTTVSLWENKLKTNQSFVGIITKLYKIAIYIS